jgi:hypothetical protein
MRHGRTSTPPRQGQKQVLAFLWPNQAEAAYAKALREGKTNQEVIGEAINAIFAYHGIPPVIASGHRRVLRRIPTNRAAVRDGTAVPGCRTGRVSYGGWFQEDIVEQVKTVVAECGLSVQAMLERGLELTTGVRGMPEMPETEEAPWTAGVPPSVQDEIGSDRPVLGGPDQSLRGDADPVEPAV